MPEAASSAILIRDGRILMIRRRNAPSLAQDLFCLKLHLRDVGSVRHRYVDRIDSSVASQPSLECSQRDNNCTVLVAAKGRLPLALQ